MKKSFIIYTDSLDVLDELTDEQAGQLFRAIKNYQNNEHVELTGLMKAIFKQFENYFIRDAKKWEDIREKKIKAGKISAEKRKQQKQQVLTGVDSAEHNSTHSTVSVNVNDSVNVNVNDNVNKGIKIPTIPEKINYDDIIKFYNEICINLPKVKILTDTRKKTIKNIIKKFGKEKLKEVIEIASKSEFLNGNNQKNWTANFDWIIKPANFVKILENNYKNGSNKKNNKEATSYKELAGILEKHFGDYPDK